MDSPPKTATSESAHRLLERYFAEQRLERLLERASWVISLSCFALVITSTIVMGRLHPFFVFVTLFGIVTRLSTLVSAKAFDAPDLLRAAVSNPDAMAQLRLHGVETLRRLLVHELRPSDRDAVAALTDDEIARLEAASNGPFWRRFARRYGVAYALLLVAAFAGTLYLLVAGDGALVGQS